MPTSNKVFVIYGRNEAARRAMFTFLRALGLQPIEWTQAVSFTKSGSPYPGEVLDAAFNEAQAVVVLLTGDDVARLGTRYVNSGDARHERELTPQARPNVLFEAGMAFGRHPDRTILVVLGETRPFSDVLGRHLIQITDSVPSRQALASRLQTAGCNVDLIHQTDWHHAGNFESANQSPDVDPAPHNQPKSDEQVETLIECSSTPRALIHATDSNETAFIPVTECTWGQQQITMILEPDNTGDQTLMHGLSKRAGSLVIIYSQNAAVVKVSELQHISQGSSQRWRLQAKVETSEFSGGMEVAIQSYSADEIAEIKCRMLLLDEKAPRELRSFGLNMLDAFSSGQGQGHRETIDGSPFPSLFKRLGANQKLFLEAAWLTAVMKLKLSGIVAEVQQLSLKFNGDALAVRFLGRRHKPYQNAPAHEIKVSGECALQS